MIEPTSTQEFEKRYGSLESQEKGSYIVMSPDEEADEIEDQENPVEGDDLDPIVTGDTEQLI